MAHSQHPQRRACEHRHAQQQEEQPQQQSLPNNSITTTTTNSRRRPRGRQRTGDLCWTTALIVCLATLNSIQTESLAFVAPPTLSASQRTTPSHLGVRQSRMPSIPSQALGAARRSDDPWSLSSITSAQRRSKPRKKNGKTSSTTLSSSATTSTSTRTKSSSTTTKPRPQRSAHSITSIADASYQLLDHDLLTKAQEYELGIKVRKFIDTKAKIEEMIATKKKEYEYRKQVNKRRREKAAEDRRTMERIRFGAQSELDDDLSMEEELEEYLVTKGLVTGNKYDRKSTGNYRSSIEELYGSYNDDDDEDAMEELGMAIYGIENYDDDGLSDGLTVVESRSDGDGFHSNRNSDLDDEDWSPVEHSTSSQLGDTMEDARLLTEREIIDELGIPGGRNELSQLLVDGALAKQRMIKSNVRLVTSIAKKWMRTSASSVHANRNADNEKNRKGSSNMGDWSTPSLDEVVQQGIVGLAIAAERFEPERKFKFSTYATYYITNEVRQIMQSATTQCLHVPPYYYTIKNKYEKIVRDHYRETGGDPGLSLDMEAIAAELKLKRSRLEFILQSTRSLVQLDSRLDMSAFNAGKAGGGSASENAETLSDILPTKEPSPEEIVERSLLRQCIENALAAELLPLERDVVRLRHGLDDGKSRTHKEVMGSFGGLLTLNDIRTAETRAYRKLRYKNSVHNARLREFASEFIGVAPEQLKTS